MIRLPARQVHLDFHTSGLIRDVGRRFDRQQFQQALLLAGVESVTVFAKCHHSWSYYPTAIGRSHPHLNGDLLGAQIAACHEIGVSAPVYYTIGFSETEADEHPDWVARNRDGTAANCFWDATAKPDDLRPAFCWRFLCPSGSYRSQILDQVREIVGRYPIDGFFFDICFLTLCWCERCRAGMRAQGLDPDREAEVRAYDRLKWQGLCRDLNAIVLERFPKATVFYNGGANPATPEWHLGDTHLEIEDLPSTGGSYDRFPLRAKYFAETGKQYVAMSGRFHTSWGEFGGYKHPDALRFEAASMIAFGARCTFGDQLHPSGEMDLETYRRLGAAYRYVKRISGLGLDGVPCATLGLWLTGLEAEDQGVANMLLETQTDFRVVGLHSDLTGLETIILPGGPFLDGPQVDRIAGWLDAGGRLLVLGEAALDRDRTAFLLQTGCRYEGPSRFDVDYIVAGSRLGSGLPASPFLACAPSLRASPSSRVEVLATIREPYFSRTYGRFCSHQNTPYQLEDARLDSGGAVPAAWRSGSLVCLAHPLGRMYLQQGARVHRDYFARALRLVHRTPSLSVRLPSAGRANLIHQPQRRRYVAHLLYGPPLPRGRCLVIEDLPAIARVAVKLRVPERVRTARLAPSGAVLSLARRKDGSVSVVVPEVRCHQAVVFAY